MKKARNNGGRGTPRRTRPDGDHDDFQIERSLNLLGRNAVEQDPLTGSLAEIRSIQPPAAVKSYSCPGCNQEIRAGTGHLVVVPIGEPSERRHWHSGCWTHRHRRRPGR